MFSAVQDFRGAMYSGPDSGIYEIYRTFEYITRISLMLYLVWSASEPWRDFGFVKLRPSDVGWGAFLCFVNFLLVVVVNPLTHLVYGLVGPHFTAPNHSALPLWIAPVYFIFAALFEELLWRSFTITRLKQLGMSSFMAVLISACLFASYHVYQGIPRLVPVFAMGLLFGCVFVKYRRIWPLAIGHAAYNFVLQWIAISHWHRISGN
jgi:membrane protease YdiL (CAAX protease family)